ncbi:MAG: Asp23/Gls24 family envelope stress response protein [Ruminococcaceae bacterium]|nr:Asp23/Gls24 family envelope stress response protein [Oscillospiraceae bacterium]
MTDNFIPMENGNIKISQEVIVRISAISARDVEGVAGLGGAGGIADFLGKKTSEKGIKVEMTDDSTTIDVHVTVKFGVKINEVAYKLQKAVKNAVESYAGIDNITVNVFVDGIEFDKNIEEKTEEK